MEDLWRRDKFEIAFLSRSLREDKDEVDDDEEVDVIIDAEDERRLGELLTAEGVAVIERSGI